MSYSDTEMMVSAAAAQLDDGERAFVGIGVPMLTCNLAKSTHAPNLELVYESGVVGAPISRGGVPTSIADPKLASNSSAIYPMHDSFSRVLQGGRIDVGFLGGAQIDRYGNINSSVIGDYEDPDVRLPGSGGACEIASNAKRFMIITPHERRRFPEEVDFVTSPGHVDGPDGRDRHGLEGGGPSTVITDKAIMRFDEDREMYVEALHPGVTRDAVQEATGWELPFADDVEETDPPTDEELRIMREVLDPGRTYIDPPEE
ncbi:MAG: CoA-transferase subunit beta [Salinirussus sp.]